MTATNLLEELLVTTDNSFFLNKIITKAMDYEIIEVTASFSSVKEKQFVRLLNKDLANFYNRYE